MRSSRKDREMATLLERAFPLDGSQQWQQNVLVEVVEYLLSPQGKELLLRQLEYRPVGESVSVKSWSSYVREQQEQEKLGKDLAEKLRPILETLFPKDFKPSEDTREAAETVAKVMATLSVLKQRGNIPGQLVEMLDNAGFLAQAPAQGAIAAGVALIISSGIQTSRYYAGDVRWDDALDTVVGDTIKAGITGVIVSAAVGSLVASGVGAPAAYALGIPLAIVVYAAVSATCDAIYDRMLGGAQIMEARRLHVDYVDMSRYIRDVYYPRMKAMAQTGDLVRVLADIQRGGGDREQLVDRAVRSLALLGARYHVVKPVAEIEGPAVEASFEALGKKVGLKSAVAPQDVHKLAAIIHDEYWARKEADPKRRVNHSKLVEDLGQVRNLASQDEKANFQTLAKYLVELEASRGSRDEPICFRVTHGGKGLPGYLHASDVEELQFFLTQLAAKDWSSVEKPDSLEVKRIASVASKAPTAPLQKLLSNKAGKLPTLEQLAQVYDNWLQPLQGEVVNPLYRKGLFFELITGQQRLFRLNMAPGQPGAVTAYICIPRAAYASDVDQEEDRRRLAESLRLYHPCPRLTEPVLQTLQEVCVSAIDKEPDGIFVLTGYRLLPLDLYTATFQHLDEDHVVHYVSYEGYFNSLAEAWVGFSSRLGKAPEGVRPGGRLLTERIKHQLAEATPEDAWALQHVLLSRLCTGMIVLDQAANQRELLIEQFAGSGVVASWYWFMSGRTRKELLGALRDERTTQALRLELMDTLLETYRVHIRSSDLFAESYDQAIAVRGQERRELSEREAVDEID